MSHSRDNTIHIIWVLHLHTSWFLSLSCFLLISNYSSGTTMLSWTALYVHFYALLLFSAKTEKQIRFTLPRQKTKTVRENMKQWSQTLNNRQLRTVIPERGKQRREIPQLPPIYYLERDNRPHPRKGESRQRSVVYLGL